MKEKHKHARSHFRCAQVFILYRILDDNDCYRNELVYMCACVRARASLRSNVNVNVHVREREFFHRPIHTHLNRTSELFRNKMVFDRC